MYRITVKTNKKETERIIPMKRMKQYASLLLALCMALILLPKNAMADSIEETILKEEIPGGWIEYGKSYDAQSLGYYASINGDGVTEITPDMIKSEIQYEGKTVSCTSLQISCENLIAVTIPDYIKSLVLSGCTALSQLQLPQGTTVVSLYGLPSLKSLTLPSSMNSISLDSCSGITSLNIPNVDKLYLSDCPNLYEIKFGGKAKEITLHGNFGLRDLTIPDGTWRVDLYDLSGVENITFEGEQQDIHTYGCAGLTNICLSGETSYADLSGCKDLKNVDLSKLAQKNSLYPNIGGIFPLGTTWYVNLKGCAGLTGLTVPDGALGFVGTSSSEYVSYVNELRVMDCAGLKRIEIPSSVESIEKGAFSGCDSLQDVYYNGTKGQWDAITIEADNDSLLKANIHYKDGSSGTLNPPNAPFQVDFDPNGGKITSIRGFSADKITAGSMTAQENNIFVDENSGFGMIMTDENGRLDCLPVAEREGYTLLGWGAAERELMSTSTVFTADAQLRAFWTKSKSYKVTFDLNGAPGNTPMPQTVAAGKTVQLPKLSDINGLIFKGWGYSEDGKTLKVWDSDRAVTTDLTLYAIWEEPSTQVAIVDGKGYGTLQAAVDVVKDGGRVEILTNNPISAVVSRTVQFRVVPGGEKISNVEHVTLKAGTGFLMSAAQPQGSPEWSYSFYKQDVDKPDPGVSFKDVPGGHWAENAIRWAVERKITSGTSESAFSPNAVCTRAQMVTFLWRAAGSPAPKSTSHSFTDINSDVYYYNAVLWAVEQGITAGTSATTFGPDNIVTRGQTVTFLHRAAGSPSAKNETSFTDVDSNAYYANAVQWAAEQKITTGTSETAFSPGSSCTRAQIVTFLYRANS